MRISTPAAPRIATAAFAALLAATQVSLARADEHADVAAAPAEPERESALAEAIRSFAVSGEIELLSSWNPRHSRANGDNGLRGPDADSDRISLQTFELLADRPLDDPGSWGLHVRLCAGETSRAASADPDADLGSSFDVREAFASWRAPFGPAEHVDFAAGKFRAPTGFEVLENSENWLVTRNPIAVFATPTTLTGVRASVPWSERLATHLYVVNGWDDWTISDEGRTALFHAAFGRFDDPLRSQVQFLASYGALTGPGARKGDKRRFFELVWDGNAGDATELAVDVVVGDSPERSWRGVAAYVRQRLDAETTLSLRVGTYDDDALGADGARVSDVSVGMAFRPTEDVTLSLEVRHDWSGDRVYTDRRGGPARCQDTVTFSVVFRF